MGRTTRTYYAKCKYRLDTFVTESQLYLSPGLTMSTQMTSPTSNNNDPTNLIRWNPPLEMTPILSPMEITDVNYYERTVDGITNTEGKLHSNSDTEENGMLLDSNGDPKCPEPDSALTVSDIRQVGQNAWRPVWFD
jgi:hypothetical protein